MSHDPDPGQPVADAGWRPFLHWETLSASPLLVGVHGWLLSGRLWEPLAAALEPRWQFWAPDLPGFGRSPRPRGLQPTLVSYGRWLADAVRERASDRPVLLLGHSLGGSLVLHAAPHLGEQLLGVVQVAAGGGVYQPRPFRMVRGGGAAFLRWRPSWLAQLPGTEAIRSPLVAELRAARGLLACSMQPGAVRQLPAIAAQLQVPSLWISGSKDSVMEPRYVRHLAGYCGGSQVQELEGEGHLPMRTAPDRLAALIETWIEDQSLAKPFS
jgi:2-succinyl-6-hydroxy-2,4-cyclohexadiene-1-carboxylate synthase